MRRYPYEEQLESQLAEVTSPERRQELEAELARFDADRRAGARRIAREKVEGAIALLASTNLDSTEQRHVAAHLLSALEQL